MERRNFIKGCLCCAGLAAAYVAGTKITFPREDKKPFSFPLNELEKKGPVVGHIEIHLNEHCNLGCKFCSHLSTIAEKEFYDVDKYEKDIARLAEITNSAVYNLELLGGEPLLHPDLLKILKISRKYLPETNIELLTNGILLNSMPAEFWITLKENKISLLPSIYPIKINWESILRKAKKYGAQVATDDQEKFITLDNIPELTVSSFYKVNIDLKGRQNKNNTSCIFKNGCVQYYDGKLFPCFIASNIRHFNKKFGKNVNLVDSDVLDLYKISNVNEIMDFLNKQDIEFCKYCAGMCATDEPWTSVNHHTIDEWLYDKEFFEIHV